MISTTFPRRVVVRYTQGDCHLLALAIHDATGWPLAAYADLDAEPEGLSDADWTEYIGTLATHVVVIAPDGVHLDIRGESSGPDPSEWGTSNVVRVERTTVEAMWDESDVRPCDQYYAQEVLKQCRRLPNESRSGERATAAPSTSGTRSSRTSGSSPGRRGVATA